MGSPTQFGGSHNFSMMLANGGSLYIDEGKPTPKAFAASIRNIREIGHTIAFNVPTAYAMLVAEMRKDQALRRAFFSELDLIFYAGASLPQDVWEALEQLAMQERGEAPLMASSWGMTERRYCISAADWFAHRDPVLQAQHLDRAEDPAAPRAYLAAARSAAARYHYELAQRLVERGEALASEPPDRFALRCLLGDILHDLGAMSAAASAYEGAMDAASSDAERCRVWLGLAAVKRITDDLEGAFAHLEQAEKAAVEQGLIAEQARSHFLRGNLLFPRGDIEGCVREHRRGLDLARRAGSAELEAMALGGVGDAEYMRGRMISAHEGFRRCIELARQQGLGRIEVANRPMAAITRWYTGRAGGIGVRRLRTLVERHTADGIALRVGGRTAPGRTTSPGSYAIPQAEKPPVRPRANDPTKRANSALNRVEVPDKALLAGRAWRGGWRQTRQRLPDRRVGVAPQARGF